MLDAPPPLARAACFFNLGERIEHRRDGLVADGVDAELQAGGVGADQPRAKGFEVLHLGGDEAVTGRVEKRLEKPRGRGPQRSVGVPFDRAEPQRFPFIAPGIHDVTQRLHLDGVAQGCAGAVRFNIADVCGLDSGGRQCCCGGVRAGEPDDLMPGCKEFAGNGRSDVSGRAGDEHTHSEVLSGGDSIALSVLAST